MSSTYQPSRGCPSGNYVCRICEIPGHYIEDCPRKEENNKKALDAVCVYHDPFSHITRCNELRGPCNRAHFSQDEFKQFCLLKLKQDPTELKTIAKEYYISRNHSCAMRAYYQLISLYPNNAVYASGYGQVLEATNDYKKAETYHLKALNLSPTDGRLHRVYAVFLHKRLHNIQTAKKYFENALKLNELSPATHNEYGLLLEEELKYKEAEYHYLKSLEIVGICGNSYYNLGLLYHYKLKDLNKARYYFDRLLSLQFNRKRWWCHDTKLFSHHYKEYALLLKDVGEIEQSLTHFGVALEKIFYDDDKAQIYYEMGRIYDYELNDIANAKWYFNEAKKLNPKQYEMFYNEFIEYHKFNSNQSDKVSKEQINKVNDSEQIKKINKNVDESCKETQVINDKIDNKLERQTKSQIAFKKYLERIDLLRYYEKFAEKSCNDMKYLEVFDDNLLENEIKMNDLIHRKYFMKEINKFIQNKTKFEDWLKQIQCEHYVQLFNDNGVFTKKLFYENVKQKEDLLMIIGEKNEFDANIIWNTTETKTTNSLNNRQSLETIQLEGFTET